jgi:peptidoglycan/LPS O-acetylase OafA/YrhL
MYPYLNGLRGVAALAVCYTHANHKMNLRNDAWHHIGEQAVLLFFVLSSFLLSFRFLVEWKKLKEYKADQNIPWYVISWEIREIVKYTIRRFFRIYPAYFTTCLFIASNDITRAGYEWGSDSLLGQHLLLRHTKHNLWTVPVEVSFYFLLPILMIVYFFLSRVDLGYLLCGRGSRLSGTSRLSIRILLMLMYAGILYGLTCITLWERETRERKRYFSSIDFFLPEYLATFVQGSVYGIFFFELHNAGLLPKSINGVSKQIGISLCDKRDSSMKYQSVFQIDEYILLPPMVTYAIRTVLDVCCYITLLLSLLIDTTALKHFRNVFPDFQRSKDSEVVQGLYHGCMILLGLLSEKSFSRLFQWNLLSFAGKISFSLYLLHPFSHQLIFETIFGPKAEHYNRITGDNPDSNFFDLFIMSMGISWLIGTISYKLIEEPAATLGKWIIDTRIAKYTENTLVCE